MIRGKFLLLPTCACNHTGIMTTRMASWRDHALFQSGKSSLRGSRSESQASRMRRLPFGPAFLFDKKRNWRHDANQVEVCGHSHVVHSHDSENRRSRHSGPKKEPTSMWFHSCFDSVELALVRLSPLAAANKSGIVLWLDHDLFEDCQNVGRYPWFFLVVV